MSDTQGYKNYPVFTLPLAGADITRDLFEKRLATVEAVVNDPQSKRVFSRADLTAMAFECLMLAKMLRTIPEAVDA